MLVDIDNAAPLGEHDFPTLARSGCNVTRRFRAGRLDILFEQLPPSAGGEDLSYIHWALIALLDGRNMCTVSVESLDLRSLAASSGVPVKELQREYGTRGYLAEPMLYIYGDGQREELGPVPMALEEELLLPYMMDYLLDSMDVVDELVPVKE